VEKNATIFSTTRSERGLSVLGGGIQVAHRIILQYAANKDKLTLLSSNASQSRECSRGEFERNC
jgi:hypothetical protein